MKFFLNIKTVLYGIGEQQYENVNQPIKQI